MMSRRRWSRYATEENRVSGALEMRLRQDRHHYNTQGQPRSDVEIGGPRVTSRPIMMCWSSGQKMDHLKFWRDEKVYVTIDGKRKK
jgi:hypothetical protein